jgi:hypothetical protein
MANVHLERDQDIIYVKHNFMRSGLKIGWAILSVEEHKLIPPISPQPYFCQKIFYLHSNFLALNFILTKKNLENFCNTPKYFALLEAKSIHKFLSGFQPIVDIDRYYKVTFRSFLKLHYFLPSSKPLI